MLLRCGRLQEVPNIVVWLGNVWHFRQLVADDRWSQLEVELYFDQHEYWTKCSWNGNKPTNLTCKLCKIKQNKTSNVINLICLPWRIIIFKGEFFNNFFLISVIVRRPQFFHRYIYSTPLKKVNGEVHY